MTEPNRPPVTPETAGHRIYFVSNGVFGYQPAGGDIHLLHTVRAACRAGWQVECFGGPALQHHLQEWNLPARMIFTSPAGDRELRRHNLFGQLRLLWTFFRRFVATLTRLKQIQKHVVAFSPTDYWFDVLPVVFSRAKLKVAVLQMQAPSLREVIFRTRMDVEPARIASLHYCFSQWLSLKALSWCRQKRLVVVQPLLRAAVLEKGFRPAEVACIPNGVDVETADSAPAQEKRFDVVWMGRVHRQKGIEDLLTALQCLNREFPRFRALLIGDLKPALGARIEELGLSASVEFSGYVSGAEKFRQLKSARLFLMPSRHEGLPIVVGEALASGLPVVAYELEMYRSFFGPLVHYVPCFDVETFCASAAGALKRLRAGEQLLEDAELARFKKTNSWPEIERQLMELLTPSI
ncbi:MAG TPA: glycosyltransferase [Verrucomicrobiae bacterium]|nr:glycosyltransferase [Verrucomicrobiae bacterium]